MQYSELLKDQGIKRWYTNISKGSTLTAITRLELLTRFQNLTKVGPYELLKMKPKQIEEFLIDKFDEFERVHELKPSYILNFKKVVKSWLDFNGKTFNANNVKVRSGTPSTYDEIVPTQEQLSKVLSFASPKIKVMISTMAFSFLRPESLGKFDGSDGLKLSDFPELEIKGSQVSFSTIPTLLVVRPSLSKAKQRYFSFLCDEGCDYLRYYLESRIKRGEKLDAETPLLRSSRKDGLFLETDSISRCMRYTIRKAGFDWRPYILRSYGDTQLDVAEAKGMISHSWRQFFMGHKGDIEARYSTNKRLPESIIEEMRSTYAKIAIQFLQTKLTKPTINELDLKLKERFLKLAGYSEEEITKLDVANLPEEEVDKMVRERLFGLNNGSKQKVIPMKEVKNYIVQGWEYVAQLPDSSAIVKLPA